MNNRNENVRLGTNFSFWGVYDIIRLIEQVWTEAPILMPEVFRSIHISIKLFEKCYYLVNKKINKKFQNCEHLPR